MYFADAIRMWAGFCLSGPQRARPAHPSTLRIYVDALPLSTRTMTGREAPSSCFIMQALRYNNGLQAPAYRATVFTKLKQPRKNEAVAVWFSSNLTHYINPS